MTMSMYRQEPCLYIALAELAISWEDKERNRGKCRRFVKAAARQCADIVIFPEMTLTGFSMNVEKIAEEKEYSPTMEFFMELSEQYKIAVAFGMAEYKSAGEKEEHHPESMEGTVPFIKAENKCYLVSGGKVLLEYAKLHPFSYGEEADYYQGGNMLAVTDFRGVKIAPFICYDLRFPEVFQMVSAQTEFIFVIANWPKEREDHWNTLLKARAIENQCYVAGINRCGKDPKFEYPMATAMYDPYGKRMEKKWEPSENKEEKEMENCIRPSDGNLYFARIDKSIVKRYREEFPLKKDRREELYRGNCHITYRTL